MRCPAIQILGVLFSILFSYAPVQPADKIRIAYPGLTTPFIPLQLAQSKGFLKDDGIDAENILMAGNVPISALVNGDIDYGTGTIAGVMAAIQGLPLKLVACYVPRSSVMLIAHPEFKTVRELKGKTIGIRSLGDNLNVQAKMILRHFGLDPEKDVKFLAAGGPASRLASLKQGFTAATIGNPPMDYLGVKMGFVVLAKAYELFSYPSSGLVTTIKKIKERSDEVRKVIKAGIRATTYIRANREGTIQFLMAQQRIDKEMAAATYDSVSKMFSEDGSVPETGVRTLIEEARQSLKANREVSIAEVTDLSILREAQKELGIKGK